MLIEGEEGEFVEDVGVEQDVDELFGGVVTWYFEVEGRGELISVQDVLGCLYAILHGLALRSPILIFINRFAYRLNAPLIL